MLHFTPEKQNCPVQSASGAAFVVNQISRHPAASFHLLSNVWSKVTSPGTWINKTDVFLCCASYDLWGKFTCSVFLAVCSLTRGNVEAAAWHRHLIILLQAMHMLKGNINTLWVCRVPGVFRVLLCAAGKQAWQQREGLLSPVPIHIPLPAGWGEDRLIAEHCLYGLAALIVHTSKFHVLRGFRWLC